VYLQLSDNRDGLNTRNRFSHNGDMFELKNEIKKYYRRHVVIRIKGRKNIECDADVGFMLVQ